ncbi:MAG: patatin-like phospholipase family protein [Myxococcales bacterium]|jgi:predicted acylesterase/phospholipase RssA
MLLVLSSGFLAFARHAGVALGLERLGVRPSRICGVSSGALVGSLLAAGHSASAVAELVAGITPRSYLALRLPFADGTPGLFSLDPLVALLREKLPARFEDLETPLAVGVVERATGRTALLDSGPLPEAVAASCAVPALFAPRRIDGRLLLDGGVADRIFLTPLLERHPAEHVVVHLVASSRYRAEKRQARVRAQLEAAAAHARVTVIETERSRASLWSLGDVLRQVEEASAATIAAFGATEGAA